MDKGIKSALFFMISCYSMGFASLPACMLFFNQASSEINMFRFLLLNTIPCVITAFYFVYRFFRYEYNGWYNLAACYILCFMIGLWSEYLYPRASSGKLFETACVIFTIAFLGITSHFIYRTVETKMKHQKEAV